MVAFTDTPRPAPVLRYRRRLYTPQRYTKPKTRCGFSVTTDDGVEQFALTIICASTSIKIALQYTNSYKKIESAKMYENIALFHHFSCLCSLIIFYIIHIDLQVKIRNLAENRNSIENAYAY